MAWNSPGTSEKTGLTDESTASASRAAILVFDDPYHLTRQDREVEGELRWQTIGMVSGIHVLLVAHTVDEDENEERVRILSARKATSNERSIYAQGN